MANKAYLFSILALFMGSLTACQNIPAANPINPQQGVVIPNVVAQVDSDGDGVTDDLDQCPATSENVVIDEIGCSISFELVDPSGMELRFFYQNQSLKPQKDIAFVDQDLEQIVTNMTKFPKAFIYIFGHISAVEAKNKANSLLAHNRAQAIKDILVFRGLPSRQIRTFDCGDNQQIAPNDTEEGVSMNQRVYALMTDNRGHESVIDKDGCLEF